MAVQTRNITVTLFDNDGVALPAARVQIKLVGMGNEPGGAVSPGTQEVLTGDNGIAEFVLWENRQDYSDTYYEIRSWNPRTGAAIHRGEPFFVFDGDADVKDLLNVSAQKIDATQALVNQVMAARAAAEAAAVKARNDSIFAGAARDEAVEALERSEHILEMVPHLEELAEGVQRNTSIAENASSQAASSAGLAAQSKNAANEYEIAARAAQAESKGSAEAAETSRQGAQQANQSATAQASQARLRAEEAFSSAQAAGQSRIQSGQSATAAAASASEASEKANLAADHSRDAEASAGSASTAADVAVNSSRESVLSAESAADSALLATDRASAASDSAATATGAASTATTKAAEAAASASNALKSENEAGEHKEAAEEARTQAETARDAAEQAAEKSGKSAYDLAVDAGFVGSMTDWLASLKGDPGAGNVSSVDVAVPEGFSVSGGPITDIGTITITFADGYGLPTIGKQAQWDQSYGWGNHADAGYAESGTGAGQIRSNTQLDSRFVHASTRGAANGVATLDANSKIPVAQLPATAITDTFTEANQAAMLALDAQIGDVCVRTDQSRSYILRAEPATVLANWQELLSPTDTIANTDALAEGSSNLYFTPQRARTSVSVTGVLQYNTNTGAFSLPSHLNAITAANVSNWNTAFGWGNHGAAGYAVNGTAGAQVRNNTQLDARYLQSESDPTVPTHVKAITTANVNSWNAASGWGNHASAGYALSGTSGAQVRTNTQLDARYAQLGTGASQVRNNGQMDARYLQSEADPTVPAHVKAITQANINAWNAGGSRWDGGATGLNAATGRKSLGIERLNITHTTASGAYRASTWRLMRVEGVVYAWVSMDMSAGVSTPIYTPVVIPVDWRPSSITAGLLLQDGGRAQPGLYALKAYVLSDGRVHISNVQGTGVTNPALHTGTFVWAVD